jgi:hypothetical protein
MTIGANWFIGNTFCEEVSMAEQTRDKLIAERLTLAQARAQVSALKLPPRVEGEGRGAPVPTKKISQDRNENVKR